MLKWKFLVNIISLPPFLGQSDSLLQKVPVHYILKSAPLNINAMAPNSTISGTDPNGAG